MGVEESQATGAADGEPPPSKRSIRVVVADDHPIVRYALRQMLALRSEIGIVGDCRVGPEVVPVVIETQADILMVDLTTSDSRIWSLLQTLRQIGNTARVIILTASDDKKQFVHALKMGCSGIILKQATAEEIANCVREVQTGRVWLDPRIAAVLDQFDPPTSDHNTTLPERGGDQVLLSAREREVVALIGQGYTNPEIAAKLFISGQTVKNHLHHIYKKTGLTNRAELVIYAIRKGWSYVTPA
jgi:DNA-binding NarL/FixJ family response regulator